MEESELLKNCPITSLTMLSFASNTMTYSKKGGTNKPLITFDVGYESAPSKKPTFQLKEKKYNIAKFATGKYSKVATEGDKLSLYTVEKENGIDKLMVSKHNNFN